MLDSEFFNDLVQVRKALIRAHFSASLINPLSPEQKQMALALHAANRLIAKALLLSGPQKDVEEAEVKYD